MGVHRLKLATNLLIFLAVLGGFVFSASGVVQALSGSDFKAGRIIDDAVFYNGSAMSAASIQNFLNAKVPTCDTNGSQPYAGTTRAAYGTSKGYPPPFVCLKNKTFTTPGKAASAGLCNAVPKRTSAVSAAQVIYDVSVACGVSPKVILVLLQKEQSLVTDDWPWKVQYTKATGFGCPDSSLSTSVDANRNGCYDQYEGFFNQLYHAAKQYKNYRKNPDNFNFIAGENNFIQYNPNAGCGGKNVYIQNQATAGLYNYTPYTPNSAALNNLYGTGNSCSAYGNRNFWRMYIDWFGSVYTTTPYAWWLESKEIYSNAAMTKKFTSTPTVQPGEIVYIRIKARNMGNKPWDNSVAVRVGTSHTQDRTSVFRDGSWLGPSRPAELIEPTVVPGEVGTFEFTMTAPAETGSHKEHFNLLAEGKTWMKDLNLFYSINVVEPVSLSPSSITLNSGQSLASGETLLSPDKQSAFTLQKDGNLVLYRNFKPVWSTGTNKGQTLNMQGDGNLVLYSKNGAPLWHTKTHGNAGARLILQVDGNLVIYTGSTPLWFTSTSHNPFLNSYVNNSTQNALLLKGQRLETADRRFKLVLQNDGNLVIYSPNRATWSSGTAGKPVAYATMQSDGNLVLYSSSGKPIWYTKTKGSSNSITIQEDGNLVIYSGSGKALWHTKTHGKE